MFVLSHVRFLFVSILLFLFSSSSICQELTPVFENISEGLPSTEVHDIYQDSKGYMWFATDRGVCRYNGDKFKIITSGASLHSNVVFKIFEESNSKVWIVTKSGRLYWFNPLEDKPSFTPFSRNEELLSVIGESNFQNTISRIVFNSKETLIFSRGTPGFIKISSQNIEFLKQDNSLNLSSRKIDLKVSEIDGNYYIDLFKSSDNQKGSYIHFSNLNVPILQNEHSFFFLGYSGISSVLVHEEVEFIAIGNKLIRNVKGDLSYKTLPSGILSMVHINGRLFIGTYIGVYELNQNLEIVNHFLRDLSITKFFLSSSNTLWLTTVQNGIFRCADIEIEQLHFKNNFKATNLFITNQGIGAFNNASLKIVFLNSENQVIDMFDDVSYNNVSIRSNTDDMSKYFGENRTYYKSDDFNSKHQYLRRELDSLEYFFAHGKLFQRSNHHIKTVFIPKGLQNPKFACKLNSSNILLIHRDTGLLRFNIKTKTSTPFYPEITNNVTFKTSIVLKWGILFSSNKGLFCLNREVLTLVPNSEKYALKGIVKNELGEAYAFDDKDIYKISNSQGQINLSKINRPFAIKDALILSIAVLDNKLWVATKSGLFLTKTRYLKTLKAVPYFSFEIDSILVENNIVPISEDIVLMPENTLKLYFDIISYDKNLERNLEYSIQPGIWIEMNKKSLMLANLAAGDYLLKIRRIDFPEKLVYDTLITVKKPFYQKAWFIFLVLLVVGFIVYLVVKLVFQIQKRKNTEELEKLNLELKLLTSKMNPHFTFNTINSIQHSIMKSDKKNAIMYLSDFALLMRKNLDFSMEERILLKEEKEFIELYVKMENKRFDSNFILNFITEPGDILTTKKVPSMLIQPLIENVILHADYLENEEKIIDVNVTLQKGYYLITVTDFGQGRKIREKKLGKHKSYGLEILRSRVKMYNGKGYNESDVSILHTIPEEKKGTRVTIKLKEWKQ